MGFPAENFMTEQEILDRKTLLEENKLLSMLSARDAYQNSLCEITLALLSYHERTPETTSVSAQRQLDTGVLSVQPLDDTYTIVDLAFAERDTTELHLAWNLLVAYGEQLEELRNAPPEQGQVPLFFIEGVPKTDRQRFLSLSRPIFWALQPKDASSEQCTVIRMLFLTNSLVIGELDQNELREENAYHLRVDKM